MLKDIESSKVAYFIGFLCGDGAYNGDEGGRRKPRIGITTTDEEVADWIDDNITEFSKENAKIGGNNLKRNIRAKLIAYKKTFPTTFSPDFKFYGILSKKEHRRIVNVSQSDMRHWIRGFFDADGHISYIQRKDRNRISGKVGFTHPSMEIISSIQKFLIDELGIPSVIRPKKGENCYVLEFSKLGDVIKFCSYIYEDTDDVVVMRKYQKYLDMKQEIMDGVNSGRMYPQEFIRSKEYRKLVSQYSKYMVIDEDGNEYHAQTIAAQAHGIEDPKKIGTWAKNNRRGWSSREKTEEEKEEFKNYVKDQTKLLYDQWKKDHPEYYI